MKKILFSSLLFLSAAVLFTSCEKAEIKDGGGKTLIKIEGGGDDPSVFPLDVDPTIETIQILDVRRDAISSGDYNQPATITLTNTQAYLDAYNDENGTSYELLPEGSYTITSASGVSVSGDTWTINLAAGEIGRDIEVTIDKSQLDLSLSYAFGVQVTATTIGEVSAATGKSIVNVLIKNKYDGRYEVTGTMNDLGTTTANPPVPGLTSQYPMTYDLITSGESKVDGFDPIIWEDYFIPVMNGADQSGYGSFSPVFTFDADGNVVSVVNIYGQPAGNTRSAQLDPTGINKWDEATGDIDVKFFMFQPSAVAVGPRVSFDWHMEYKGPRE